MRVLAEKHGWEYIDESSGVALSFMKSPIDILHETNILDERMRKRISGYYRHRGEKALEIVDYDRVIRYRDFFGGGWSDGAIGYERRIIGLVQV